MVAARPSAAKVGHGLRHRADQLADRLPPLMVAADRVAATVAQGVHGRRRVGVGETFWQFRPYQPGDSTARIDWRQSARSTQLFLRDQEWEAAESVWLWADVSGSMQYRSDQAWPEKAERALLLLLALAALLVRAGERVALLGAERRPMSGRAGLDALCDALGAAGAQAESLPPMQALPRHARVVLLSDFLTPLDRLRDRLRRFVGLGVRGHLLQILDPAELELPFNGRVQFDDLEPGASALIGNVEGVRARYQARMDAHRSGLRELGRSLHWTLAQHVIDRPPEPALLALYSSLATKMRA